MPIELLYVPEITKKRQLMGYITPGSHFLAYDRLASGEVITVSVYCLPDDDGFEVYEFNQTELDANRPDSPYPMVDNPVENKIEDIKFNTTYSRDITDKSGDRVTLIFKHIGSVAGQSMN